MRTLTWRAWTAEDDAELGVLHNQQRLDYGKIGERLGRTRKAVAQRVSIRGWVRGRTGHRAFSVEEAAVLERMWLREGHTYGEIALALGRPGNSIISRVHRMGWAALNPRAAENAIRGKQASITGAKAARVAKPKKAKLMLRPIDPATRPANKRAIASPEAKPWTERGPFQCAYPIIDGERILSCCNRAPWSPYCLAHEWVVYARPKEASHAA